jgi:hypothetical protein
VKVDENIKKLKKNCKLKKSPNIAEALDSVYFLIGVLKVKIN